VFWDLKIPTLGEAFDKLAGFSTSAVTYGVDASGDFFFRVPTGSKSLGYAADRYVPNEINSSEIVTEARLVVSTENPVLIGSRNAPTNVRFETPTTTTPDYTDFLGDPILYTHTDASNATYGATQTFEVGLVEPCKANTNWTTTVSVGITDPANAYDGNPATYAYTTSAAAPWLIAAEKTGTILGFDVEYSTAPTAGALRIRGAILVNGVPPFVFNYVGLYADLPKTDGHTSRNKVRFLLKYDGADPIDRTVIRLDIWDAAADALRVYSLEWLEFNPALEELAKSYIKTPATRAATYKAIGYQAPTAQTTITGHPTLGSIVFNEQSIQYNWTRGRGLESMLLLGDRALSEEARALRQLVDNAVSRSANATRGRR
jgi:hypothetical protein